MSANLNFVTIPLDSLVGDEKIDFDLYVVLSFKHVVYARKGDVFDLARLQRLREINVPNLWIRKEDEELYRKLKGRTVEKAYDLKSSLQPTARAAVLTSQQAAVAETLMKSPTDKVAYSQAVENVRRFTEVVTQDDLTLKILLSSARVDKSIAKHGVSVAAAAVMLAQVLNFGSAKDLYILGLGCLLHDAGHFGVPGSGFGKKITELTPLELKTYKEHTIKASKTPQIASHYDSAVVSIIAQHEELANGTGFPNGLTEKNIHPLAMIVATANCYDKLVTFENETPTNAVKRLVTEKIGLLPTAHLNAMRNLAQLLT